MSSRRHALSFLAVVVGLLVAAGARAASFEGQDSSWRGTSELVDLARRRLGPERVVVTGTLDYGALGPSDGVLVLRPEVALDFEQLSAFLRAGGRLAVLDDYGAASGFFERFHIRRIPTPRRPAGMLRENPALAVAVPVVQEVAGYEQGRHPVVAGVSKLVTNHATALTHPNLTPVLEIPAIGEPNATLAVTGIIANRGRLLAMGDPSVVINQMLRYPGNRAFAEGLVDYLVEDDSWGARGGKLYVVANRLTQRGRFGGKAGLADELSDRLSALAGLVTTVRRDGLPELAATLLAALAALGVVAWMGVVSTRPFRPSPLRFVAETPLVAQGGAAGRAAVLAAPTTERVLALLELRSALVEGLGERLGLAPGAAVSTLVEEIDRQGALGRQSFEALKAMLAEMNRAEAAVMASRSFPVKENALTRVREQVLELLAEADARRGRSS